MTVDDLRVLRDAAQAYRAAAVAAGLAWPGPAAAPSPPADPDLVRRLFDVDHVPEPLRWLESQGWDRGTLFPHRGELQRWPTEDDAGEALDTLSFSVGTPFHWRHQIPLFRFSVYVYTFVLEGDHEGEIWRYLLSPDQWDPVRAAPGLAALFSEWTKGITAGVIYHDEVNGCLFVGDPHTPAASDVLQRRAPDLDPLAFPIDLPEALVRQRQRECGVDLHCLDRGFGCWQELIDDVLDVRASLGL